MEYWAGVVFGFTFGLITSFAVVNSITITTTERIEKNPEKIKTNTSSSYTIIDDSNGITIRNVNNNRT